MDKQLTRGRPKGTETVKIDLVELEKLCGLQCTIPEIAAWFKCSESTINKRRADDEEFRAVMDRGFEKGKASIRRHQMRLLEEGNATMAIWLGKQYLGQKEPMRLTTAEDNSQGDFTLEEALIVYYRRMTIGAADASSVRE